MAASSPRRSKQRTVATTTLEIERPADFSQLALVFRAERYVLPDDLRYFRKPASDVIFAQIHTSLRDQLNVPYKAFKHDRLEGKPQWAVYALFPRDIEPPPVILPWRDGQSLPHQSVSFTEMPFHITLKLLQIALFRGVMSTRFVGQDQCYTYAGADGRTLYRCVRIELQGVRTNREGDQMQTFRVIPHAVRFGPADLAKTRPSEALFAKRAAGNRFYFLHLKTEQVRREPMVYHEVRLPSHRAHVKYHDPDDLDASRGKILDDFIRAYLAYLRGFGIIGTPRYRTFVEFKAPDPDRLALNLTDLGPVGVYDNRCAHDAHPLTAYIVLLTKLCPQVTFMPVANAAEAPMGGLLVLLDASAADFVEEGVLAGRQDPYRTLYEQLPHVPKQSLIVNFNDPNALSGKSYLDYPFPGSELEPILVQRLEAALTELYLKCALIHGYERFPLPLLARGRAFVRRRTYHGASYTTALWFDGGQVRLADLGDREARERFVALVRAWGVDYDAACDAFLAHLGCEEEPASYDLILGADLFLGIEDMQERVLYAYAETKRRRRERAKLRPIEAFTLSAHYDTLKPKGMRPLSEVLVALGGERALATLNGEMPAKGALERSCAFYAQLLAFDRLLEELATTHPTISLDELLGEARLADLHGIFGTGQTDAKASRRWLLHAYRRLNLAQSDRGRDVQLSQGIWHDDQGTFVVGAKTAMSLSGQEKAHLIRRFWVVQGDGHFVPEEYLAAMAVQFIRPRQYTVLPYYYHLIDLYIMNVRRYDRDTLGVSNR